MRSSYVYHVDQTSSSLLCLRYTYIWSICPWWFGIMSTYLKFRNLFERTKWSTAYRPRIRLRAHLGRGQSFSLRFYSRLSSIQHVCIVDHILSTCSQMIMVQATFRSIEGLPQTSFTNPDGLIISGVAALSTFDYDTNNRSFVEITDPRPLKPLITTSNLLQSVQGLVQLLMFSL